MNVYGLVHQRWRYFYIRCGGKRQRTANDLIHMPIGVFVQDQVGVEGVHPVDISALLSKPAAEPKSKLACDDWPTDCGTPFVACAAILCRPPLGVKKSRGCREAWLIRDEPDGTAQGMITQEYRLRPTQNFHTIEVEGERNGRQVSSGTVGWYG